MCHALRVAGTAPDITAAGAAGATAGCSVVCAAACGGFARRSVDLRLLRAPV